MSVIKWAKKVSQEQIERLYTQDSRGIADDTLADEVGWALYARCESIISVTYGLEHKTLICQRCGADIVMENNEFNCSCGFSATLKEFRASYKNKQLYGANAITSFIKFRRDFPRAKEYREKMIAIDTLIHSFHVLHSYRLKMESPDPADKNLPLGRPVGVNIIEGSLSEVIPFLDRLSAAENLHDEKRLWQEIVVRANGYKNNEQ